MYGFELDERTLSAKQAPLPPSRGMTFLMKLTHGPGEVSNLPLSLQEPYDVSGNNTKINLLAFLSQKRLISDFGQLV